MGWPGTWRAVSVPQVFAVAILAKGAPPAGRQSLSSRLGVQVREQGSAWITQPAGGSCDLNPGLWTSRPVLSGGLRPTGAGWVCSGQWALSE